MKNPKSKIKPSVLPLIYLCLLVCVSSWASETSKMANDPIRNYLKPFMYSREFVEDWISDRSFPFSKYDAELGYLHKPRQFKEGFDDSIVTYTYDENDARTMFAHADQPCRINTYGNSFASCEQVNDCETWQEYLASHLYEPVRNYGIGGYSVYQAYRRMKIEEQVTPAKYIIVNIFDDDHYRNLLSWQRLRFYSGDTRKAFHPTLPHVRVDPVKGTFEEMDNFCPTPESVYNLTDIDWVYETFKDDHMVKMAKEQDLISSGPQGSWQDNIVPIADSNDPEYTKAALYSTMRIVELIEKYAKENNKKVLYVLSFRSTNITAMSERDKRFDIDFVKFMESSGLPFVDMWQAHAVDFEKFNCTIEEYRDRYYVGHYNPLGNFFCAFAIKSKMVEMMDPKPVPYRE